MQTDNTIILANEQFLALKEDKLQKAKLIAKPKEKLTPEKPLIFNRYVLT